MVSRRGLPRRVFENMTEGINIGKFDTPVTFQQPVRSQDSVGQEIETFSDTIDAWAELTRDAGGEQTNGQRIENMEYYSLTTHYQSQILTTWRVKIDSLVYVISRIDKVGRNQYMRMKIFQIFD